MHGARIVVAPLDWGLGHAARCVPIIEALLERGAVPLMVADGAPLAFLRTEFPSLAYERLPGLAVRYGRGNTTLPRLALRFPAMLRQVHIEHRAFAHLLSRLRPDAVISDQRFGVRAHGLPNVLITHQVFPVSPIAQGPLRRMNVRHIAAFDRCWVYDRPEAPSLAGDLSHAGGERTLPPNARYIGIHSRLLRTRTTDEKHDVVAVLSGPEPQRTILEHEVIAALHRLPGNHAVVRGLPRTDTSIEERSGNVLLIAHADRTRLSTLLTSARLVIARSGYTTLMDLACLGRNALLIPTPSQPEQELLARLHVAHPQFTVQRQGHIDIGMALGNPPVEHATQANDHALLSGALDDLQALLW